MKINKKRPGLAHLKKTSEVIKSPPQLKKPTFDVREVDIVAPLDAAFYTIQIRGSNQVIGNFYSIIIGRQCGSILPVYGK